MSSNNESGGGARTTRGALLACVVPMVMACSLVTCTALGPISPNGVLERDARADDGAFSQPGPFDVIAERVDMPEAGLEAEVFRPRTAWRSLPGVVFLPALMAPASQYQSYGTLLASWGVVTAIRGRYGFSRSDAELARDASAIADRLVEHEHVAQSRLAVAGHSMGATDAILAAVNDRRFRAVVAIEPDNGGDAHVAELSVPKLEVPLLIVGAEFGDRGWDICNTTATNYNAFFRSARCGTALLLLEQADHVQVMDAPDDLELSICRVGAADSRLVRARTRRATMRFLARYITDRGDVPSLMEGPHTQLRYKCDSSGAAD